MLSGISFTCFAASYAVGLLLELGRVFYQLGRKPWLVFAFAFAGFFVHTYYLVERVRDGIATRGLPLSNWYHWCIVAAWMLALIYILLVTIRSENTFGLFLLPLILLLLGISQSFPQNQVFSSSKATRVWGTIHGVGLLFGTVTIAVGFMAGLMYLLQSYRLKHKVTSRRGLKLPSLEWLRGTNERSLVWSTFLLVVGVLAGVILNLAASRNEQQVMGWGEPVVWTSGLLVLWLITSVAFMTLYKPAREGQKVAYLTVTSFLVLVIALSAALGTSNHGASAESPAIKELAQ